MNEKMFSLVVFCSHAAFWQRFVLFFLIFWSVFIVHSRSYFYLFNEHSLNCVKTWSCYVFYFVVKIFVTSYDVAICFVFSRSCNFNWIPCVTSFFIFVELVFLFVRLIKFLVTWLASLKIDFLTLSSNFLYSSSKG